MAVIEVLVSMWVGFLCTEAAWVLLGPGETSMPKKGMKPLSVGFSMVNCI